MGSLVRLPSIRATRAVILLHNAVSGPESFAREAESLAVETESLGREEELRAGDEALLAPEEPVAPARRSNR